ncbi:alcohol dehydrogenase catalytic domain-containing protein [Rhodococcus sp. SORGH_AS_0301]|uniref:alcohol dehydrogenase catalytic domain-containing protein n=1 Tax=Rhodococcus sp. SORGH_AS_0301 TaxID=3041780 RepID=UPI00277D74BC|nr:alcohol dehydrogenase catalytic domain-containing protein [Rhodococcus sp. SORGH_AS_0301]MDQ1178622.1 Zn-dependent alcohol dehydrogenase [Rhodococcus sp. SORGH_AS_0301]
MEYIELDPPSATEVMVEVRAVGVCHTEQHAILGELPVGMTPMVLGHEGAGVVTEVGSAISDVAVGDHVAFLWQPACGACEFCVRGEHHRCQEGRRIFDGPQFDGTYRRRDAAGATVGSLCMVGAFAEQTVVDRASIVVVDRDLPFDVVALASCSVVGGHGAVANAAEVQPGDDVLVVGAGGQGSAAVQAANAAGARRVIVADHHGNKLDAALGFGATILIPIESDDELAAHVLAITAGRGVDHAIVCTGSVDGLVQAYRATRVGGAVVQSGITPPTASQHIPLMPIEILNGNGKNLVGSKYGGASPITGIPHVLNLYRRGVLNIEGLVTRTYTLDQVADAYDDLAAGKLVRGLVKID